MRAPCRFITAPSRRKPGLVAELGCRTWLQNEMVGECAGYRMGWLQNGLVTE